MRESGWVGSDQPNSATLGRIFLNVSARYYETRSWPRAAGLGKQLRRLAPNLRALGVEVETGRRSDDDRQRFITLRRIPAPGSSTS